MRTSGSPPLRSENFGRPKFSIYCNWTAIEDPNAVELARAKGFNLCEGLPSHHHPITRNDLHRHTPCGRLIGLMESLAVLPHSNQETSDVGSFIFTNTKVPQGPPNARRAKSKTDCTRKLHRLHLHVVPSDDSDQFIRCRHLIAYAGSLAYAPPLWRICRKALEKIHEVV